MFCPNCGFSLNGEEKFCRNCGNELEVPQTAEIPKFSVLQAEIHTCCERSQYRAHSLRYKMRELLHRLRKKAV